MNVMHRCSFWICSSNSIEGMKTAKLSTLSGLQNDVLSTHPLWWTRTAKAIAGIVFQIEQPLVNGA
jgi:hypothetical protein